jgi:hypothetical protein
MAGYGPVDDAGVCCKLQGQPVLGLNHHIALQHRRQETEGCDTSGAASLACEAMLLLHTGCEQEYTMYSLSCVQQWLLPEGKQ